MAPEKGVDLISSGLLGIEAAQTFTLRRLHLGSVPLSPRKEVGSDNWALPRGQTGRPSS